jgi:hypothetical protein
MPLSFGTSTANALSSKSAAAMKSGLDRGPVHGPITSILGGQPSFLLQLVNSCWMRRAIFRTSVTLVTPDPTRRFWTNLRMPSNQQNNHDGQNRDTLTKTQRQSGQAVLSRQGCRSTWPTGAHPCRAAVQTKLCPSKAPTHSTSANTSG